MDVKEEVEIYEETHEAAPPDEEWMIDEEQVVAHEETVGEDVFIDLPTSEHVEIKRSGMQVQVQDQDYQDYAEAESIPTWLPRDERGETIYTLNLPELLSHTIAFDGGLRLIRCFSKRCTPQLAFGGYLYSAVESDVSDTEYVNWRCVNARCTAQMRTAPGLTELRQRGGVHCDTCTPDDVQIRLRVAIYDLRLIAEFTDAPLDALYTNNMSKLMSEECSVDIAQLFPPFYALDKTLQAHRDNKIYRKRFEMQAVLSARRRQLATPNHHGQLGRIHQLHKYRRNKPFPPVVCMDCGDEIRSQAAGAICSQDLLVEHLAIDHHRQLRISNYTFRDSNVFEHWIRELVASPRGELKLRRLGIFDENMYYVCAADHRHLNRQTHSNLRVADGVYCSAFVRVHNFRQVQNREIPDVCVEFCLDHVFHVPDNAHVNVPMLPEAFIREMNEKKKRTVDMIRSNAQLQRVKRFVGPNIGGTNVTVTNGMADGIPTGRRGVGASARGASPDVHVIDLDEAELEPTAEVGEEGEKGRGETLQLQQPTTSQRTPLLRTTPAPYVHLTKRANFHDSRIYNYVLQMELQLEALKERMQSCRSIDAARKYLTRTTNLLDQIIADPNIRDENPSVVTGSGGVAGTLGVGMGKKAVIKQTSASALLTQIDELAGGPGMRGNKQPEMLSTGHAGKRTPALQTPQSSRTGRLYKTPARLLEGTEDDSEGKEKKNERVFFKRTLDGQLVMVKQTTTTRYRVKGEVEKEKEEAQEQQEEHADEGQQVEQEQVPEKQSSPVEEQIIVDDGADVPLKPRVLSPVHVAQPIDESPTPVKRGRGRPRKHPLPTPPHQPPTLQQQ